MIKKILLCFSICLANSTLLSSQTKKTIPDIEKTYLHTDRSQYTIGESLWYKVYSVYAYNNLLFDHSNMLYVELISPDSKIISRNKTRIEKGLGHGDFKLTDSVGVKKAGVYQIRAYTNWNRNFGEDFVFKKTIEILDVFKNQPEKKEASNTSKSIKEVKTVSEGRRSKFSVQFFPEGGSLVENVLSVVAFKAVDDRGKPIAVECKVFDSDGALVSIMGSIHDGMGQFQLKPTKGKTYHAEITTVNGVQIKADLPKAIAQGYVISSKKRNDKDIITISTNDATLKQNPNAPVTIICTTRGITYFEGTQPLENTTLSFELPTADFPDGISQVTLYDANLVPQTERLVYVEKEHDLQINLSTNKKIYKPNEKVTVNISSKTKTGDIAPGSFSLSSTDMNGVEDASDYGTNISSYFLMESDIRGHVHNPGYYFDKSNPKRLAHLDLLLLTQGWRDFLWKKMPILKGKPNYNVEKGITVTGIVKKLFGRTPKVNNQVTLGLLNKGKVNMLTTVTDSMGRFTFENMVFMGNATMMLNTQDRKRKNRGMIVLDSLHQPAMETHFKSDGIQFTPEINTLTETVYKKHIMFGVAPENVLEEVEIIGKKKKETPSLYGRADRTYVFDEKTPQFSTIQQLIQFTIPGVITFGGSVGFNRYNGRPAHIIIDGVPSIQEDLDFIQPSDVAKIESMNSSSAAIFGSKGANGVIIIYLKEGVVNKRVKKVFHSITQEIAGFYDARQFYSPDLENPDPTMDNRNAIRNTLFWDPYVHPNESGVYFSSYYNSAAETRVKVTLEGITASGIPVVVKTHYNVEK
ncbi:TonB-dependent receptor plug domain-containing protein [Gelatiniphilus marinus]|uniref:TonB-dependent receptor plug domain-containing protein n=1 Tax=Gelatiniphilus marinus TaxID=1759464 RepID=A0ABW5JV45_9FLAO